MNPAVFANIPLAPPPPGQKSDFDAPAHDARTLWVLSILSVTMAFMFVVIRLYVKRFISRQSISWDDGACMVALTAAITHTCVIIKELDYGLGKKMWNVRALSFTRDRLVSMTSANFIIAFNMLFVRLSVLALYQRLFGVYETSRKLIYLGYAISVLIALPEMGVAIGRMVKCSEPTSALTVHYCSTSSISSAVTTFAVTGVVTDIFIYSIAFARLRLLHVKRNKKIQLVVVFSAGLIALVFGVANMIFVAIHFYTKDQLWYALWVAICKLLEANIALTCACATFVPAFWTNGKQMFSSIGSFRSRSQNLSLDKSADTPKSVFRRHESDDALVDTAGPEMGRVSETEAAHSEERVI